MLTNAIIVIVLLAVLYTLGSSFYFMVNDKGDKMLNRLKWRIGLSIFLLLVLYVMFSLGWIEPSRGPINYGR